MPSKVEVKVEDNFLDQEVFKNIHLLFMGNMFPWYYQPTIDFYEELEDKNKFQFVHVFYERCAPTSSTIEKIMPIMNKIDPIAIWRIKANLLTKTPNIIENEFHIDMGQYEIQDGVVINTEGPPKILEQSTTSIFYVNTNNGYTKFEDGTKVESVANRLISFSSNTKHKGTSCTDEETRIIINFNYFK